ncbi:SDR family NAD(P)-dependent oxidoreductase [Streptomyces sp. NPDC046805]|uniref:SDR family NAD(P)-dependent oxidoreductase n=1 Tax=Streptomyces sp. NPDC046805 TaxID=3155134 RepID=UPI0034081FD0
MWVEVDIADYDMVAASVPHIVEAYGGVDVLVNNAAGSTAPGRFQDTDPATCDGSSRSTSASTPHWPSPKSYGRPPARSGTARPPGSRSPSGRRARSPTTTEHRLNKRRCKAVRRAKDINHEIAKQVVAEAGGTSRPKAGAAPRGTAALGRPGAPGAERIAAELQSRLLGALGGEGGPGTGV